MGVPVSNPLLREGLEHALGGILGIGAFLQQRRDILKDPNVCVRETPLPIGPVAFALQPAIIMAMIAGLVAWWCVHFTKLPESYADVQMGRFQKQMGEAATPLARASFEQLIEGQERSKKLQGFTDSLTLPLLVLSVMAAAFFFRLLFAAFEDDHPGLARAEQAYLYLMTARAFPVLLAFGAISQASWVAMRAAGFEYAGMQPVHAATQAATAVCAAWYFVLLIRAAGSLREILGLPATREKPDGLGGTPAVLSRLLGAQLLGAVALGAVRMLVIYGYQSLIP
jgi:hypothetical protein